MKKVQPEDTRIYLKEWMNVIMHFFDFLILRRLYWCYGHIEIRIAVKRITDTLF